VGRQFHDDELEAAVDAMVWEPAYVDYEPVPFA
jgi:hypothetical protein